MVTREEAYVPPDTLRLKNIAAPSRYMQDIIAPLTFRFAVTESNLSPTLFQSSATPPSLLSLQLEPRFRRNLIVLTNKSSPISQYSTDPRSRLSYPTKPSAQHYSATQKNSTPSLKVEKEDIIKSFEFLRSDYVQVLRYICCFIFI